MPAKKYWLALPSPLCWLTIRPGAASSTSPGRSTGRVVNVSPEMRCSLAASVRSDSGGRGGAPGVAGRGRGGAGGGGGGGGGGGRGRGRAGGGGGRGPGAAPAPPRARPDPRRPV